MKSSGQVHDRVSRHHVIVWNRPDLVGSSRLHAGHAHDHTGRSDDIAVHTRRYRRPYQTTSSSIPDDIVCSRDHDLGAKDDEIGCRIEHIRPAGAVAGAGRGRAGRLRASTSRQRVSPGREAPEGAGRSAPGRTHGGAQAGAGGLTGWRLSINIVGLMGRGDRRKSPKMRQRVSRRKLKARQKAKRQGTKKPSTGGKSAAPSAG